MEGLAEGTHVYFVHSYYVKPRDASVIATETDYGGQFCSMIWRGNLFATQFHPEKSQADGLRMLRNFGQACRCVQLSVYACLPSCTSRPLAACGTCGIFRVSVTGIGCSLGGVLSPMQIWPAIDLRGGKCVRLQQGDYGRETVFGDDPAAAARRWVSQGAECLHLVDLDGARDGQPVNLEAVRAICRPSTCPASWAAAFATRRRSANCSNWACRGW